jgi:anti-sigma factor RsiW
VAAGAPVPGAVEAHLASCEACRTEVEELRQALAVVDGEMAGLLAAEPSPELAVRIRQAVAASAEAPGWRFGWLWPAAAAAATLAVALVAWPRRGPEPGAPAASSARVDSPALTATASATVAPPAATRRSPRPRAPRGAAAPEVLVPPGEAEALLRFAAHLRTRVVPPDSLLVADLSAPLPEPKGVEIQPLEIVPLDPAEASGTD